MENEKKNVWEKIKDGVSLHKKKIIIGASILGSTILGFGILEKIAHKNEDCEIDEYYEEEETEIEQTEDSDE